VQGCYGLSNMDWRRPSSAAVAAAFAFVVAFAGTAFASVIASAPPRGCFAEEAVPACCIASAAFAFASAVVVAETQLVDP